jgi:hypothetical protein
MTSTITEVTITTIVSNTYDALSTTVGVIAILLLLVLLIQKELTRAFGGPRSRIWMRALDVAIVPLLLTFSLIVIMRFVDLLSDSIG